jgi:16S rRNA (guanine966-N2)-methyltransferase
MTRGARPHEVRLIGGQYKRSKLPVADRPGLRPTPDRVRETLFNWLGQELTGWRCLDAFAGSGALGFEAASRGACDVVLIESDPVLAASLRQSQQRLAASALRVVMADALAWMASAPAASFDLVFIDPPYADRLNGPALEAASRLLSDNGFVYLEGRERCTAWPPSLSMHRQARAGAVHFHLLQRAGYTAPTPA